jgi:hypothetical protein
MPVNKTRENLAQPTPSVTMAMVLGVSIPYLDSASWFA